MIIFDLDGTLSDCEHRRHFVDPKKNENYREKINSGYMQISDGFFHIKSGKQFVPDWESFYESCNDDLPIWPVITVYEELTIRKSEIQIWSGRSESVREKTEGWLKYMVGNSSYSKLKMRPIGDFTPDDVLKERWLDEFISERTFSKIDFVFDDRPKVVRMWRRRGLFVFNCNQSDEEF